MIKKVIMPAAGQTTDVATVTKVKVAVGDAVKKGDILLEVETDKAVLPIESFAKGFVTEIYVSEFDKIDAGSPLLAIGDAADLEKSESAVSNRPELPDADDDDDFVPVIKTVEAAPAEKKEAGEPSADTVKAMPNAKKLAAELGVGLENVSPSNGVFIKASDVRAAAPSLPEKTAAETVPTARIRKTLARRWDDSANIPSFTVQVNVSTAAVDAVCPADGIGRVHFVILALAKLAARYPLLRVRFENGTQKLTPTVCAGLSVFAENGTVSATVPSADALGLTALSAVCRDNIHAVSKGDLSCVGGASFTVFDLTDYRIDCFTAPLCAPEVCAFGVTGGGESFTVTGTFDIRVFEGSIGASVMSDLRDRLENPALLLL